MKNRVLGFIKNNYAWLMAMFLSFLFLIIFMVTHQVKPFGNNSFVIYDGAAQVYPFMTEFYNKLTGGESLFYSWCGGLGGNFLAIYFYYLASPLNLLIVLSGGDIEGFVIFTIITRIVLSAGTFGFYLSKKNESRSRDILIIPLSLAYSLSSFMFVYFYESMWLDSVMLFPLIMYGYDRLMKEKKPVVYILSLALSAFANYYITVMIALFLILWFFIDDFSSVKDFIKKGLMFAGSSLLAAGMSAVSIIVSFMAVMSTHIGSEKMSGHSWFGNIFELIRYQFAFSKPHPLGMDVKLNTANIYAGTFVFVLVFCYLFVKTDSLILKIKRMALLLILLISMNESVLNYIWHSLHVPIGVPNRFSFLFIFLVLLTSYELFGSLNKDNMKRVVIGMIFAMVLPMVSYFFVDFDSIILSRSVLIISLVLIMIYSIFVLVVSFTENRIRIINVILSMFMIGEIAINGLMCLSQVLSKSNGYVELYDPNKAAAVDYIKNNDTSEFYRMDVFGSYNNNGGYLYGSNGTELFCSIFPEGVKGLFVNSGVFSGKNGINSMGYPDFLEDIISEKYIVINKNEDFYSDRPDYTCVYDNNDIVVYENTNALSLGFGVSKDILSYKMTGYNPYVYLNGISSHMGDTEDLFVFESPEYEISSSSGELTLYEGDYLYFEVLGQDTSSRNIEVSFSAEKNGSYYTYYENNQIGNASGIKNGNILREGLKVNELSYIGEVSVGDEVIFNLSNNASTDYRVKDEAVSFLCLYLDRDELNGLIEQLSKNEMNITDMTSCTISAEINLDDGQLLFTSIPYDEGWHVYENGTEISKVKIEDALIGLDLGAGNHTITFKYIPQGFYLGLTISIISCLFFILLCVFLNRHSAVSDNEKEDNAEQSDE